MKAILPVMAFAARHLLIVLFGILTGWVVWTIGYLLLLVVAIIGGGGLGGPLAYPAGIIAILLVGIVVGWGVFCPACLLGRVVCKVFELPKICAIPVVFISAFALSFLTYWAFIGHGTTDSMPSLWVVLKNYTIFLSVPLGAYWWVTEGPGALYDAFRRWIRKPLKAGS